MKSAEKVASRERAYEHFNERRIGDLLAMMADEVQWPDVAHGVVDVGLIIREDLGPRANDCSKLSGQS